MEKNAARPALMQRVETLVAENNSVAALSVLTDALKSDPQFYVGWLRLSRILFENGHFQKAVNVTQEAEQHDPLQSEFREIQSHMQTRNFTHAERLAQRMLARIPGHPRAAFTIAEIARIRRYPEYGAGALRNSLQQTPANLFLRNMLIGLLEQAGDYQGAIDEAAILVKTQESFQTLWTQVSVLLRLGQNEEVLQACHRAMDHSTADPRKLSEVELVRGQVLRIMGQQNESIAAYRACLKHNPMNAGAWWALADMKTFSFADDDIVAIRKLIDTRALPPLEESVAEFALAKASESAQDWDETMSLYRSANNRHPNKNFNPAVFSKDVDTTISAFDAAALRTQAYSQAHTSNRPIPIFIIGLPRSGSTLIEQILASHSQIEGTIEQPTLPSVARKAQLKCIVDHGGNLPEKVTQLSEAELSALGQAYIDNGALFRAAARPFFTDKQPFNFRHIGLIHKLLPEARIIDARRNPLDCGLSLYKQHFPIGVEFSYALNHIGSFYNGYLGLMDHWSAVLPGRVLTVNYERLVREPEATVRDILAYIGVPFETSCLTFYNTKRAVRTASSEQVRRPMNTRGIGTWRNVAGHLTPLRESLGPETLARFQDLQDP